jgi:hypothetical protein
VYLYNLCCRSTVQDICHTCMCSDHPSVYPPPNFACLYRYKTSTSLCPHLWLQLKLVLISITNSVAPESEGSSPYSQDPATGPYPEPTGSTLHPPPQPISQRSILIPSIYALVFQVVSFLLAFPSKPCTLYCSLPCVPHVPLTSFALISSA